MKLDMILAVIFVIAGAVWTILGEYPRRKNSYTSYILNHQIINQRR